MPEEGEDTKLYAGIKFEFELFLQRHLSIMKMIPPWLRSLSKVFIREQFPMCSLNAEFTTNLWSGGECPVLLKDWRERK